VKNKLKGENEMNENSKKMIEEYQCPGCFFGSNVECGSYMNGIELECGSHQPATHVMPVIGTIYLGLPKGFNRTGYCGKMELVIYESKPKYDFLNIPVWKYFDQNGNTIVRGICPRITKPFLHIYIGNHIKEIDCIEITQEHLDKID